MSLIISKQLPQTLSNDFAIVTVTNFYADLRIVGFETYQDMDSKKMRGAANITTFYRIKNFLFTCFFVLRMRFHLRIRNSFIFYKTPNSPWLGSRLLYN